MIVWYRYMVIDYKGTLTIVFTFIDSGVNWRRISDGEEKRRGEKRRRKRREEVSRSSRARRETITTVNSQSLRRQQ